MNFAPRSPLARSAYTLLELLIGMAIFTILACLSAPAIQALQGAGKISNAAYEVAGVLQNARTYATTNRTYVWVGFFEENAGVTGTAGVSGTGRVILSVVASKDGTQIFNENGAENYTIPAAQLLQVGKLVKIENVHLSLFEIGTGAGDDTFAGRPAVDGTYGRYGEINSPSGRPSTNSRFPFQYPLNSAKPPYKFPKTLMFTPRGEACVNGTYKMRPVLEIGLRPARGNVADSDSQNAAVVQISGILGHVKIYQP